ncbi:MAG TPA: polyprenyl synthetase family protein [Actinomycetota bacterium]|nr:polyprenyl synthetase family protein [Actinomycetota bacterium]
MTHSTVLDGPGEWVPRELTRFLKDVRAALPEGAPLLDEIERMTAAGGKRLRPAFCYWGFRTVGNHCDEILRAAASLELLHTFAIVHDDIMDRSSLRRGQPTVHELHGSDFAILAGDLALVLADDAFLRAGFTPATALAGFTLYSRMRQEVIAGQWLDLAASGRASLDEDEARHIAILKSGRYSIEMPLLIGAALGRASDPHLGSLAAVGAPLGEAFQLRDDLLGTFGEEESLGKSVDSDIRAGKRNMVFAATAARLSDPARARFEKDWGRADLSAADVEGLRALVESSGARAALEASVDGLLAAAMDELARCEMPLEARRALEELAEVATRRSR